MNASFLLLVSFYVLINFVTLKIVSHSSSFGNSSYALQILCLTYWPSSTSKDSFSVSQVLSVREVSQYWTLFCFLILKSCDVTPPLNFDTSCDSECYQIYLQYIVELELNPWTYEHTCRIVVDCKSYEWVSILPSLVLIFFKWNLFNGVAEQLSTRD